MDRAEEYLSPSREDTLSANVRSRIEERPAHRPPGSVDPEVAGTMRSALSQSTAVAAIVPEEHMRAGRQNLGTQRLRPCFTRRPIPCGPATVLFFGSGAHDAKDDEDRKDRHENDPGITLDETGYLCSHL